MGERETVVAASGSGGAMRRGATRRAAAAHRERGTGGPPESAGVKSGPSSRLASPHSSSPRLAQAPMNRHGQETPETGGGGAEAAGSVAAGAALVAAQRILTLATESLDMMRGVTGVVKDSLDRADACVFIKSFF